MKLRFCLLLACNSLLAASISHAAPLYWDGTDTDGDANGGDGTWIDDSGTTTNWDDAATGGADTAWNNANNDTAVFGATTGTVTLGSDVTVGGLQFDTLDYVVAPTASETITLAAGSTLGSSVNGSNGTPGRSPYITAAFAGSDGFTKTAAGRIYLNYSGSSSLTGDIKIAAGQLYARFSALGSGDIIFTGNSDFTKVYGSPNGTTKGFTVNDGVSATIGGSTFYYNFATTGVLAGNTSASFTLNMGNNTQKDFNNTGNTFTGVLYVTGGGLGTATNQNGSRAGFKSLADSSQKLRISNAQFLLNNGGVSMNFANRQLEILNNARIDNDSTNSSVTMTFAQDVLATIGNNSRNLYLSGVNTGANTIAGKISDSATGTGKVSVAKWEAGTWVLSGANDYTGATTVSAGTLTLGVDDCLADASNVVIGNGTLNVADTVNDTAGTLDVTNAASTINLGSSATLAFADSSAVDWTGGALDITGTFVEPSSLRFGTNANGLTSTQLGLITLNGSPTSFSLDSSGYLVTGAPSDPYTTWAGAEAFDGDANGDGVSNGLAWLLGATGPNVSALDKLPTVTETGGGLVISFTCLNDASNGDAVLTLQHSSDLGITDAWTSVAVPNTTPGAPTSGVTFAVSVNGLDADFNDVTATISSTEAVAGKLFGRLEAVKP